MDYHHNHFKPATMSNNNINKSLNYLPMQGKVLNHVFNNSRSVHLTQFMEYDMTQNEEDDICNQIGYNNNTNSNHDPDANDDSINSTEMALSKEKNDTDTAEDMPMKTKTYEIPQSLKKKFQALYKVTFSVITPQQKTVTVQDPYKNTKTVSASTNSMTNKKDANNVINMETLFLF
jgi:hypothetical protein